MKHFSTRPPTGTRTHAFTLDHGLERACALFVNRYGHLPEACWESDKMLRLGPIEGECEPTAPPAPAGSAPEPEQLRLLPLDSPAS